MSGFAGLYRLYNLSLKEFKTTMMELMLMEPAEMTGWI